MGDKRLVSVIQGYLRPLMLKVMGLGFASGLPLALTASTMTAYLQDNGVSLSSIGLFALVGVPYSFKFAWAPLLDQVKIPWLTEALGRRKGWILLLQALLVVSIFQMGLIDVKQDIVLFAIISIMVSFLSASQDVVIDAMRIEMVDDEDQGAAAAASILGYRLGMLSSGAGALYVAHYYSWQKAYYAISVMMLLGMAVVLMCKERKVVFVKAISPSMWIQQAFIGPFSEFIKRDGWLGVLALIGFYKMSDAFAGAMTTPFLMEIGFNKQEIASVVKVYGLGATLLGFVAGGGLIKRLGYYRALFVGAVAQMLSNLVFVAQAIEGYDIAMLMVNISIENFASGLSGSALVAYISHCCSREFTATQYALFSAIAVMARTGFSAFSGSVVEACGWIMFFIGSSFLTLPALYFLKCEFKKGEFK